MAPARIAIYGATGHTGRLVAAELLARGQDTVLAGRDADALKALAASFDVPAAVAPLDDPGALRALAEDATVLIHCAGPFSVTGEPVARAAAQLSAETDRIPYADGALHVGYVEPRNAVFPFPPPLGPRSMIAPVPFPEAVTIPRHVPARTVEAQLTAHTFTEEGVFTGEHVDLATRAGTDFTVAVQAIPGGAGQLAGRDLWRAGAPASVGGGRALA